MGGRLDEGATWHWHHFEEGRGGRSSTIFGNTSSKRESVQHLWNQDVVRDFFTCSCPLYQGQYLKQLLLSLTLKEIKKRMMLQRRRNRANWMTSPHCWEVLHCSWHFATNRGQMSTKEDGLLQMVEGRCHCVVLHCQSVPFHCHALLFHLIQSSKLADNWGGK